MNAHATDAAGNTATGLHRDRARHDRAIIPAWSPACHPLPPNHKMVAITLNAVASDNVGVASLKITSVTSNEPDNGLGDGDTAGDWLITGDLTLNLRAERGGTGNGRTYTITRGRDAAGNATTKTVAAPCPKPG